MNADDLYRFRVELADIKAREAEHQRDHNRALFGSLLESCLPAGCSPDASDVRKLIRMVDALLRNAAHA